MRVLKSGDTAIGDAESKKVVEGNDNEPIESHNTDYECEFKDER